LFYRSIMIKVKDRFSGLKFDLKQTLSSKYIEFIDNDYVFLFLFHIFYLRR